MAKQANLSVKITKTIREIPQKDWESVFPKAAEGYNFFKTLDESGFDGFSFFYIIIYDNGEPVGVASCFSTRFALDMTVTGPLKFIFRQVRKIIPNLLSPKIMMCGLPMGTGQIGVKDNDPEILRQIEFAIEQLAEKDKAALIVYKDFTFAYDQLLKPLLERGYHKIESIPSTEMEIDFSSFDDYLKKLSPSSREGFRRHFKKIDSRHNDLSMEVKGVLNEQELAEVYALYLQTYEKQGESIERLPLDFFRLISVNMPEETKFFLWRIEGKIAAFAFCLAKGGEFIDYYLGFDYALIKKYYLYFVRFRALLNWCIEHKIKRYEMGVTSYETKRRLGFKFVRFYFYMKHCNPVLNKVLPFLKFLFSPEHFEPVFKVMNK